MKNAETKKTTAKRLALTRQTVRALTKDELRLVAGGAHTPFRSCGSACA